MFGGTVGTGNQMNKEHAYDILRRVRYRKPFDVEYRLNRNQQRSLTLALKAKLRDEKNAYQRRAFRQYLEVLSSDPEGLRQQYVLTVDRLQMAAKAARYARANGSSAHIGRVGDRMGHAFCVADYEPNTDSPSCIEKMACEDRLGALVIDPWMNIVCKFSEYPATIKEKTLRWELSGKYVVDVSAIAADGPYNVIYSTEFIGSLFYAPLRFEDNLDPTDFWLPDM
jgi:hypothetical protein